MLSLCFLLFHHVLNSALTVVSEVGLLLAVIVWSRSMTLQGHFSRACRCSLVLHSRGVQGDIAFPALFLYRVKVE